MDRLLSAVKRARAENSATSSQRPFVTAAWAQSLDGCLSRQRGRPTALSSPESLRFTHALRAAHDAVLVGIETVLGDNPQLTVRLVDGSNPRRVVLDSQLRTPLDAHLVARDDAPWLVAARGAETPRRHRLEAAGAVVLEAAAADDGICVHDLLEQLQERGIGSVMVEGGARVLSSFFGAGLVDAMVVTVCPRRLSNPDAVRLDLPSHLEPRRLVGTWGIPSGADWIVPARIVADELLPLHGAAARAEVVAP